MAKPSVSADRRRRILQVAFGLFAATPYHEVHVDEIAAAAGVAKPTLYRYFATKEALFIEALQWGFADLRQEIGAVRAAPGSDEKRLRQVIALMLDRVGRLSPAIRAVESRSSDLGEQSRHVLRRGFSDLKGEIGLLLDDGAAAGAWGGFDTEVAVLVVLGAVRMAAHATSSGGSALAEAVADILLDGFRARRQAVVRPLVPESNVGVLA